MKDGSRLGALLGERAPVKSHHHQGFGRVGEGLVESAGPRTARSRRSRIPSKRFAVGVLWHPEEGEDAALFEALVEEARAYRAALALGARAGRVGGESGGVEGLALTATVRRYGWRAAATGCGCG